MLERTTRPPPEFEPLDWSSATPSSILVRIDEAGIVGMGGAGYPTVSKLASGLHYGTQHVVANGVECEPGVHADRSLMRQHLSQVIEGLRIVGHCLGCDQLTLAVADRETYRIFQTSDIADVKCEIVSDHPANGEERTLIRSLFDRTIPPSAYPSQHCIVVLNVATLFAICEAVRDGYRPTDRVLTVFDEDRWVDVNTSLSAFSTDESQLRLGSVATGTIARRDATIDLTTNAVAHDRGKLTRACIHCGWCDEVCPRSLPVEAMLRSQQSTSPQDDLEPHFDACFECGACVVVCPSAIPLLDWIRQGKLEASARRLKQRAHKRFERRNQRLTQHLSEETDAREARIRTRHEW